MEEKKMSPSQEERMSESECVKIRAELATWLCSSSGNHPTQMQFTLRSILSCEGTTLQNCTETALLRAFFAEMKKGSEKYRREMSLET